MRVEIVSDDAFVDIVAEGFDAGVRFGESLQRDMVAVPLGPSQRFVVVVSPDFVAAMAAPNTRATCSAFRACESAFSGAYFKWGVHQAPTNIEVDVDGPWHTNDMP